MKKPITAALAVTAALGLVAGLAACAPSSEGDEPTSITIAVPSLPLNWNPFEGASLSTVDGQAVHEALVDAEGVRNPRLATAYDLSSDGRTMSMTLREGVTFTDGTEMTAEGVADYLTALFAADGYHHKVTVVDRYQTEVVATGEYDLTFTTATAMRNDWFLTMGETPIVSPETIGVPDAFADGPVGTGPYLVEDYVADQSLTLVRNPDYWDPESYDYDEVTFIVYQDNISSLNALKLNEIDVAPFTDLTLSEEAENSGLSLFTGFGPTFHMFFIDRAGATNPAFADLRVRQAINMAFDREGINEQINFGLGNISSQMYPEGSPLHVPGGDDVYPYDLDRARELMAEAGYADGFDVKIPVTASIDAQYQPILQQSLADIGIRVEYVIVPDADIVKMIIEMWPSGDYPMSATSVGPVDGVALDWIPNFQLGYGPDPVVNEIIERYRNGSVEDSQQAVADLGKYMLDEAWYVPIGNAPTLNVAVEGITIEQYPGARYAFLHQYKIVS